MEEKLADIVVEAERIRVRRVLGEAFVVTVAAGAVAITMDHALRVEEQEDAESAMVEAGKCVTCVVAWDGNCATHVVA